MQLSFPGPRSDPGPSLASLEVPELSATEFQPARRHPFRIRTKCYNSRPVVIDQNAGAGCEGKFTHPGLVRFRADDGTSAPSGQRSRRRGRRMGRSMRLGGPSSIFQAVVADVLDWPSLQTPLLGVSASRPTNPVPGFNTTTVVR